MLNISVVVPAYNEEKRIGKTLEAYSNYFEGLRKKGETDYEILVVINNTTDRTEEIVKEFCKKNARIRYLNLRPGGKGFAVREGFKESLKKEFDLIGFVDADLATGPDAFYDLIRKIGNSDGAIASRYLPGAIVEPGPTVKRLIAARMFNILVRTLLFLSYKDTQCGAKVFTRKAIENSLFEWTMSEWAFDTDLLYAMKKKKFRIKEVPTRWSDRSYSKVNFWKAGPQMALGVIRLRLLNSPAKKFIRIYDNLIGVKNG
jgi:glycosyltransferase involved in cell wall biosynthesis